MLRVVMSNLVPVESVVMEDESGCIQIQDDPICAKERKKREKRRYEAIAAVALLVLTAQSVLAPLRACDV